MLLYLMLLYLIAYTLCLSSVVYALYYFYCLCFFVFPITILSKLFILSELLFLMLLFLSSELVFY